MHAYLFSGPRGTGKTSTARILAKALNCTAPSEGDPCNACESCVAITAGSSLDVLELDAASHNGVDDIRELSASAWIHSPGHKKVYIIDEVHMLSKAAGNALLKTLEEPPPHVVFVLATTDPHKVPETIRSRTQHLEFRLIPSEVLATLLEDVRRQAKLTIDDETIAVAVARGRGSARDALSALDQLVASGSSADARPDFGTLIEGFAKGDAVEALTALANLARHGWDPETLGESLLGELRQCFLLLVAPDVADAYGGDRERLAAWGHRLSLPKTVRVIETIGRALRAMNNAPDPTVVLEVTVARLTHPELDDSTAALEERLAKLEHAVATGATVAAPPTPPPTKAIGGLQKTAPTAAAPTPTGSVTAPVPAAPKKAVASVVATSDEPAAVAPAPPEALTLETFVTRFSREVLPPASARSKQLFAVAQFVSLDAGVVTVAVPDEGARLNGEELGPRIGEVVSKHFGVTIRLAWVVDEHLQSSSGPSSEDLDVELDDYEVAESETVDGSSPIETVLRQAFPGAEEVS